ncbi:MAG: hypothetical protein IH899_09650 [Planctomycetes bacterium]|nr:hypothetical protein [Planctomycetota bacterium]
MAQFLEVKPGELCLPSGRQEGAVAKRYFDQVRRFGGKTDGMPFIQVTEGQDGELMINDGVTRADFVRIIFKLWDSKSELVAQDSAFVVGEALTYLSGVASDTALNAGQEAIYQVRVDVPDNIHVEYFTREINFNQID